MWKLISSLVKNNSTSPGTRRRGSLRSAQPSQDFLLGRAGALAGLPGTPPCGGRGQRRRRPGPRWRPGRPAGRPGAALWGRGCAGVGGRRAAGGAGGDGGTGRDGGDGTGRRGSPRGPSARGGPSPAAAAAAQARASATRLARGPGAEGQSGAQLVPRLSPAGQPGLGRVGTASGLAWGGPAGSCPGPAPRGRPSCLPALGAKGALRRGSFGGRGALPSAAVSLTRDL